MSETVPRLCREGEGVGKFSAIHKVWNQDTVEHRCTFHIPRMLDVRADHGNDNDIPKAFDLEST
eukprot:2432772-Amphidinium_carterae.1